MTTQMTPEEAIDRLRSLQPEQRVTANAAQIRIIIEDVTACRDLDITVARPELNGLGHRGVMDVVAEFGKYRARVKKRSAPKADTQAWYDSGYLFPPGRAEVLAQQEKARQDAMKAAQQAANPPKKRKAKKPVTGSLTLFALPPDSPEVLAQQEKAQQDKARELVDERPTQPIEAFVDWNALAPVILPHGYERDAGHGRDIAKSIAAIVVTPVEDEEIIRFVARHYEEQSSLLDADHVHLLWWVLSEGLTHKLAEIGPANTALAGLFVQAYDLLDVARTDALNALRTLVSAERDPQVLATAFTQCRWLAPHEMDRLARVVNQVAANPDNDRFVRMLDDRMRSFALWVRQSPATFAITSVAKLTEAHLLQILANSGLLTDESAEKEMVAELRQTLSGIGLAADLDREIAEGLRAWKLGRLDEFYASRQARVDGDPDWAVVYAEALADAELQQQQQQQQQQREQVAATV